MLSELSPLQRSLAISIAAAVFMAIAGPFGTWREPLLERLGFWVIGIAGCALIGAGLDRCLKSIPALRAHRNAGLFVIVAGLIAPAALAASVAAALLHHAPINWKVYWQTLPEIGLVSAGVCALLLLSLRRSKPLPLPTQAERPDPTISGLLPLKFSGANLLAIEAHDHYVRVHTDRGTDLVLMNFEMAVAKAAHLNGQRVHRSWWVARAAVIGVERGDGRATLALRGGARAPVSRRYAKVLRSTGWY
ncbi:MAG: LytTR family DNA-binding domain-containing protein [Alphaproteobacteria bacterium]